MVARTVTLGLLLFLQAVSQAQEIKEGEEQQSNVTGTMAVGDTILMMNRGSPEFLIDGDVLISRKRSAKKCYSKSFSCLWPMSDNGKVEIPFTISDQYAGDEEAAILKALEGFHSETCIRFIPRKTQRMYLQFKSLFGCFSSVGRIGERQVISLQRFGCVNNGIIQHEVMHALGFYHEHTRSDRDQYIQISWENIQPDKLNNFKKRDTNNLGMPYDYQSVTHYGRRAFSSVWKDTITPIPDASVRIGRSNGLSGIDIQKINKLYKCWSPRF
ncbi:low choriolytic enzyme [Gadus morhua]|uniref:Metalloendopeptidase n=1 Tax=Gadus morhua TaxID=8049 RepID=A0A8C4ZZZ8_GADMO|nr:low choriolytic enzyme-like [Gadus morhua]